MQQPQAVCNASMYPALMLLEALRRQGQVQQRNPAPGTRAVRFEHITALDAGSRHQLRAVQPNGPQLLCSAAHCPTPCQVTQVLLSRQNTQCCNAVSLDMWPGPAAASLLSVPSWHCPLKLAAACAHHTKHSPPMGRCNHTALQRAAGAPDCMSGAT